MSPSLFYFYTWDKAEKSTICSKHGTLELTLSCCLGAVEQKWYKWQACLSLEGFSRSHPLMYEWEKLVMFLKTNLYPLPSSPGIKWCICSWSISKVRWAGRDWCMLEFWKKGEVSSCSLGSWFGLFINTVNHLSWSSGCDAQFVEAIKLLQNP